MKVLRRTLLLLAAAAAAAALPTLPHVAEAQAYPIRPITMIVPGDTIIPIVYGQCPLGGIRPYFLCPGNSAAGCGRRVFQLYLSRVLAPRLQFLCRHCTGLVYTSKYERPWRRASRRASKLRQRLGITGLGVPEKPKDMPVPVYARLLDATLRAEIQATEAGTHRLLRLVARLKPRFTLD